MHTYISYIINNMFFICVMELIFSNFLTLSSWFMLHANLHIAWFEKDK